MAIGYLLDPQLQISDKSGALNVAGFLRVYLNGTDDRAVTYKDFNGTLNPADIVLDNNGRAVVIADSSKAYRLEVYTPDGDLLWSQYPINTIVGGAGGASGLVLESSDSTVDITKYSEGGITHYDLSTDVSDSTELLDWVTCSGSTVVPTNIYRPTFVDGTMTLGDYGVRLAKDQYYHVTAHITCTKSVTAYPYADDIQVHFKGRDNLTGDSVEYQLDTVNVDYSTLLPETKELSLDIKPSTDVELVIVIDNSEVTGASFSIKDLQVHRVYSGAPHIPGGVQRTLIAGANITIEHTGAGDVISSTGGGGSGTVPLSDISGLRYSQGNTPVNRLSLQYGDRLGTYGYMGIKCDPSFVWNEGSVLHTRIYLASPWFGDPSWAYVYPLWYNVTDPSKYICATNKNFYALHDNGMVTDPVADTTYQVVDVEVNSYDLTWSQPGIISTLDELSTSDWAFTYVSYGTSGRFPTGEDGVSWSENCVRGMFAGFISDGKMYAYLKHAGGINTSVDGLYVDQNYFQKKLTAGTGIDITNNTIGVKIDGSTITTNASGELVANGGGSAPTVQYIQEGYAEGYIETSGITTLSFTRLSDSWDTYVDPTCAYLLRVTLGGASQSGLGELVYGSHPSISLENWQYVDNFQYTYVSSAIPQLSGMDISPWPSLHLNVSFLGEPSNRVYIVKPPEPIPEPFVGGGEFLQLKLRDVTCDVASTLKMKADLFKITPTQYVWRYPWQY